MNLENLRNEYPKTPDFIHEMIESEVQTQMKKKSTCRKHLFTKYAVAGVAAVLCLGTVAFAGNQLYKWYFENEGDYGVKLSYQPDTQTVPNEVPVLSITPTVLPDGFVMAENNPYQYHSSEHPYLGGFSIVPLAMDTTPVNGSLGITDRFVVDSEQFTVGNWEGVYLKKENEKHKGDEIAFNQTIYLACPEYYQVVVIHIGEDVTKEQAIAMAQGLDIKPSEETISLDSMTTWSEWNTPVSESSGRNVSVALNKLNPIVSVGQDFTFETVSYTGSNEPEDVSLSASVTDVQLCDDFSLLDPTLIDERMQSAVGEDGKLLPNTISYLKSGDGVNTLDTVLFSETVNQKLAVISIKLTNTTDQTLDNILYNFNLCLMEQTNDTLSMYDRALADGNDQTNAVSYSSIGGENQEMDYYSPQKAGKNYIESLAPGESVTIQIANVINADEADKLFLSAGRYSNAYEINPEAQYIDILQ